jgi:2-keto-4-pentenoate hydratase
MADLTAQDVFHLAFVDWISALVLARSVGGVAEIATALDATERMRTAIEAYAKTLPASSTEAAPVIGRLRGRVDAAARWLYGRKSGAIRPPKPSSP